MSYVIHRVDGAKHQDQLRALHTLAFPDDDHVDYAEGWWWIVYSGLDPVAFAGMRIAVTEPDAIYWSRCGVLAGHRGQGLQRRLITARLRHSKSLGARAVITTTYENPPSGNNLIRAGFRLYTPVAPWCCEGTNYWRLDLPTP